MEDIDGMLARLATVAPARSLGDDPAFVARLNASATRGAAMGLAHSAAIGVMAAVLMLMVHVGTSTGPNAAARGGPLLMTAEGMVL